MQYPSGTTSMFDYMEARGGQYAKTVFFGLQYILKRYFSSPIEMWEVDEAKQLAEAHGEPFDYEGWKYIVEELGGKLPVRIRAVPEGSIVPVKNALVTIDSTDERVFWVVGYLETILMKTWYPTTIATKSYYVKEMLKPYLEETGGIEGIGFKYHNFGDRGSSSVESAAIGGMAHLTQFMGTDNFDSLRWAKFYYEIEMAGYSIVASEHSTVTSWGRDGEFDMYEAYIERFKNKDIIACVMDSYNIYEAVDYITKGSFKEKIESPNYPIFVIRPDSGIPVEVLNHIINTMEDNSVGYTVNEKGYKVWNKYRIIWGDGVTPDTIEQMVQYMIARGYSADNIAFGSGGDLMQNVNRDSKKFAIKCSSITVNCEERDVFKDPITDQGKTSKKGRITTYRNRNTGEYFTKEVGRDFAHSDDILQTVYENGVLVKEYTMDEIRQNSLNSN
jgi:nicotinamide phosphoribosyltransferase